MPSGIIVAAIGLAWPLNVLSTPPEPNTFMSVALSGVSQVGSIGIAVARPVARPIIASW